MPPADTPEVVRANCLMRFIHASADWAAWSCWAFHQSLGSKSTPRKRYVLAAATVVVQLALSSVIVSGVLSIDLGEKFISASFISSKGELWLSDHLNAPPSRSIIFLSF